jgi:hypothetical protein
MATGDLGCRMCMALATEVLPQTSFFINLAARRRFSYGKSTGNSFSCRYLALKYPVLEAHTLPAFALVNLR